LWVFHFSPFARVLHDWRILLGERAAARELKNGDVLDGHPDPFLSKANIRVQGPCSRDSNRTESLSYDSNEEHQSFWCFDFSTPVKAHARNYGSRAGSFELKRPLIRNVTTAFSTTSGTNALLVQTSKSQILFSCFLLIVLFANFDNRLSLIKMLNSNWARGTPNANWYRDARRRIYPMNCYQQQKRHHWYSQHWWIVAT